MDYDNSSANLKAEFERLQGRLRELELLTSQNSSDKEALGRQAWHNQLILHNSPDGLALFALDGTVLDANPALCRMLGYTCGELLKMKISDFEASESTDETIRHLKEIRQLEGDRFETRLKCKDGQVIDVDVSSNFCEFDGQQFLLSFLRNITKRKRAEEALQESEEKYRTLIEMSPYAIAIMQDGKVAFVNQMAVRLFDGGDSKKAVGKDAFSVVASHDRARLRDYAKRRYEGDPTVPIRYRAELLRIDGQKFTAEIFSNRITYRGRPALQVMMIDFTEQEKAARALQDSENKFRTLVEQINAITYEALPAEKITTIYVSPQIQNLLGFKADDVVSDNYFWITHVHPDDRQRLNDEMAKTALQGLPLNIEYRVISKEGKIVWVHDEAIAICDESGKPASIHGVIMDITRLKETEATLASSEQRFQELFNSALEGILVTDRDYVIQFCNPSIAKLLDIDVSEIIGKTTLEFVTDDQKQIIMDQLELRKKSLATQYELNVVTRYKNRKTLLVSSSPLFDPDGKFRGSLSAVIDITERKELEKIQTALMRISEAANLAVNLEDLLKIIRSALGNLVNADNFYVALWDEKNDTYTFPCLVDSLYPVPCGSIKLTGTLTEYVRKTGQPLLADREIRKKLNLSSDFYDSKIAPRSWLGVPLKIFERLIGVVAVQIYNGDDFYTERDLKYLSMVAGHIGMAIERKRAEENLRESERRFHELFEHFASGYILGRIITDDAGEPVDYVYLEVNKAFEKMTGKSASEVVGKRVTEVFSVVHETDLIELCGKVALTGTPASIEHHSLAIGRLLETLVYSPRYGEFASVFTDITEKRTAEKALRDSEERYRAIWENSPVGICMTDRNGVYQYVNKTYCDIYGFAPEELIGHPFFDLIMPPERRASAPKSYAAKFGSSKTEKLSDAEVFIRKNGEPVSIQYTSDYVMQDGQPIYEVAMNIDVTETKQAADALRQSEEKYRLLIENAGDIIVNVDYKGTILLLNRSAARYFKKTPSDMVGQTIWDLFPGETAEHYIASIRRALDNNEAFSMERMAMLLGEPKWFRANLQPISGINNQAASVMIITRDVTVQKHIEAHNLARLELLQRLRQANDIDECLAMGCQAIFNAQLFRRAVLTLHNEQRAITNLGQVGLEEAVVAKARKGSAPDLGLVKKMMQPQFLISRSYFVPIESGVINKPMDRLIPQKEHRPTAPGIWQVGDELFIPIMGNDNNYEGWLSVDTPFNGLRPSLETVTNLEEIVDITSTQVHEIRTIELLKKESKALEDKHVTLREILTHIDEEKMEIRQRIGNNVSQILIPAFNKLFRKDGTVNKTYYNILKEGLPDLVTASGAVVSMYYRLSPREREICHMIKSGSTSKEIAATLNISLATVQKHRELIRRKLGLINKDVNLVNYLKGV